MDPEQREALDEMVVKMRAGRMSRRTFVGRAAALGLGTSFIGTLLEACGSGASSSGPTVVTWTSDNDPTGTYQDLVTKFNASQKNVQVNWTNGPSDSSQLRTKFTTMLRARGHDTDVMSLDIIWPPEFGGNGWTVPLESKWPASERQNYLQGPIQGCTYQGKIWAAPFRTDFGLLYYRTDIIKTPPTTWSELQTMAAAAVSSGATKYGYVWQGKQNESLVCNFVEVIHGFNGFVLDQSDSTKVTATSQQVVAGLTSMVNWVGSISPASVTTYAEDDARLTWQNGDAAFMRNWPYAIALGSDASKSKIAGKFDVHPMLHSADASSGHSALGGWNFGINAYSDSKTQDAAWQFIHYMLQPDAQKEAAIKASLTVALQSVYSDADVLAKQPLFAKFGEPLKTALPRPVTAKYPDVTQAIQETVHAALLKQSSPADAMNTLQSKLQGIVK